MIHMVTRIKDVLQLELSTAMSKVEKSVRIYFYQDKSLGTNGSVTALSHG